MTNASPIAEHYSGEGMAERLLTALGAEGVEVTPVTLAAGDQFHTGGLESTRDLAKLAGLQPGTNLLDVGAGLGGPSRILASEFGCDVTGIDITPEFVRSANMLTERCGLGEKARFELADALALPFADRSFDAAWTVHVVMNIKDRATLYREIFRVLRPGGTFAFFDILEGNGKALDYPLPWAMTSDISFVYNIEATRAFLAEAGFEEVLFEDSSERYRGVVGQAVNTPPSGVNLRVLLGEGIGGRMRNAGAALADGRLKHARGVYRRP